MQPEPPLRPDSPWRAIGASVAGTSHRRSDRSCEDFHAYRQLQNGTLLLAVADGAGSASRAAQGADWVVHAAIEAAGNMLAQHSEPTSESQWSMMLNATLHAARATLGVLASRYASFEVPSDTADDVVSYAGARTGVESDSSSLRSYATTFCSL